MMSERTRNLFTTAVNLSLLAVAGIACALMHMLWKPLHQGFACGDESISKPYFPNTMGTVLAGAVGLTDYYWIIIHQSFIITKKPAAMGAKQDFSR